jgi:hypothetical protein
MLIRHGYEMTFTCGAPTSMVSQLDVHPSCVPAVRAETPFAARPHVASWLYADVFGNRCRRFNAPSGDLTISNAGVIETSALVRVAQRSSPTRISTNSMSRNRSRSL